MEYTWQDLPKPMSAFTVRNACMIDLDRNKIVQYYSANTKLRVVQKCITPTTTYYRTAPATEKGLNWALKAAAFGLPNEHAPSALSSSPSNSISHTPRINKNGIKTPRGSSKDGEKTLARILPKWIKKLLKRR